MAVRYGWGGTTAGILAEFFLANTHLDYISHSEILCGRATDFDTWSTDVRKRIRTEFATCLRSNGNARIATAWDGKTLVGMALVQFPRTPYAVLDDIIVEKTRRERGIGDAFLTWIMDETRTRGFKGMLLESGIRNKHAHAFYLKRGFTPRSITFAHEFR